MLFYSIIVGLALVWLGGAAAKEAVNGPTLLLAVVLTSAGAILLGLIYATQERFLQDATRRNNAAANHDDGSAGQR
jgi:hypothetical protein